MHKKKSKKFKHLSVTGKLKRLGKHIGGALIFLTLPTLLFYGFLYLKFNEPLPQGTEGEGADTVARTMLDALNHDAYNATDVIRWNYDNRHSYTWYKSENRCEVFWSHIKVDLDLNHKQKSKVYVAEQIYEGVEKKDYVNRALKFFNNDSFWVVAPYKVFDAGVTRKLVTTEDGNDALLVTYTKGGSTPGDSYLWHFEPDGRPKSFQMWVDILPIDGLEASWADWTTTTTGAILPTSHKLLVFEFGIFDIDTK